MPIDAAGNRADAAAFFRSGVARLNPSQFYDQYINAASRDLGSWIRINYNLISNDVLWDRLMAYYAVAAPLTYKLVSENYLSNKDKEEHLLSIVNDAIYLTIPADNEHVTPEIFDKIEAVISPTYGPVTYRDLSGEFITTKDNVFIGVQQMIILEKTELNPMAVSSGVLQHHGLLAGGSKSSRTGYASKVQTTKVFSETEVRLYAAYLGGYIAAMLLTMNNSPEVHKMIIRAMQQHAHPSGQYNLASIKAGNARPLLFINSVMTGYGLQLMNY